MRTGRPDPLDAATLALEHDTAVLTGALACRLILNNRADEADQITHHLARAFSAAKIGLGAYDTDTPGALAHVHDAATIGSALIGRLALDGRLELATQLAPLLRSIRSLDTQDDHTVEPRAHCHRGACELGAADGPVPPGVDVDAWRSVGVVGLCLCSCPGCRTMPRPVVH